MAETVEEHLAEWAKQAPTCFVTPAERAFIADMRRAAASGVGYGWMQQMIEVEWNAMVAHGGWGPAYFERQITELRQRIEELESETPT